MKAKWLVPGIVGSGFLIAGTLGCVVLLNLKKPPAEASTTEGERPLHVEVMSVSPESVPTTIDGYGVVQPLEETPVSAEVSGTVVWKNPNLVAGGVIEEGDTLLRIDSATYESRVRDAEAVIAQWETAVRRLEVEWENEKARLAALQRALELAKADYDRAKLTAEQGIGSQADVDKAERAFVDTRESVDGTERDLALFPIRIEETRNNLKSAQEKLALAKLDLEKTVLRAPFKARVKSVDVARDQLVLPADTLSVLADDSVLEIHVPLDGREARRWLRFDGEAKAPNSPWFTALEPVDCEIRWTEDPERHAWVGRLDRVISFEEESRTLTVAIRVDGQNALPKEGDAFPLVEGMFCKVTVPGRDMRNVFRLPNGTVTIANTVYTLEDERLRTAPVQIERSDDAFVFVSEGLEPGDQVITTRLVNPLENTLCKVVDNETPALAQSVPSEDVAP